MLRNTIKNKANDILGMHNGDKTKAIHTLENIISVCPTCRHCVADEATIKETLKMLEILKK